MSIFHFHILWLDSILYLDSPILPCHVMWGVDQTWIERWPVSLLRPDFISWNNRDNICQFMARPLDTWIQSVKEWKLFSVGHDSLQAGTHSGTTSFHTFSSARQEFLPRNFLLFESSIMQTKSRWHNVQVHHNAWIEYMMCINHLTSYLCEVSEE